MLEFIRDQLEAVFYIVFGTALLFIGMFISDLADRLFGRIKD